MKESKIRKEFWRDKRVLITGHTGFKGSWLTLWLESMGSQITGIALEPETTPNLFGQLNVVDRQIDHHIVDIKNLNKIKNVISSCQPEIVFHLAAQPLVRRSYLDPLGTWRTNVEGSLNILEALKNLNHHCSVVMITTDKVYENKEWIYGYRENDQLGGHDPYSASKAAAEIAISSWRSSFCGQESHQTPFLSIATARAGNVIGGGDWAENRIIPDVVKALTASRQIEVRNPMAKRPWQHVLEPLNGYLYLAEALANSLDKSSNTGSICTAFNFGPSTEGNRTVEQLIEECLNQWQGSWIEKTKSSDLHEAGLLHLQIDKAKHMLGWEPKWRFETAVERTITWYKKVHEGENPRECCMKDLMHFHET